MEEEMVSLCLRSGEIHFMLRVPMKLAEKMGEIRRRYPIGYWDKRGTELMRKADEELKKQSQPEQ